MTGLQIEELCVTLLYSQIAPSSQTILSGCSPNFRQGKAHRELSPVSKHHALILYVLWFRISSALVTLSNWTQTSYYLTSQHQHHVWAPGHTPVHRVKMQISSPGDQYQPVITLLLNSPFLLLEIKLPSWTSTGSFHTQRRLKLSLHQELVCKSDTSQFENTIGLPKFSSGKESACQHRRHKRCLFDP